MTTDHMCLSMNRLRVHQTGTHAQKPGHGTTSLYLLVLHEGRYLGSPREERSWNRSAREIHLSISHSSRTIDSRCGDECRAPKPSGQVARHGRRGRVPARLRVACRLDCVARVAAPGLEARAAAKRALALHRRLVRERPHVHVCQRDVVARRLVRAKDLDRRALHAVGYVAIPVL